MADSCKVLLTSPQVRSIVAVLGATLGEQVDGITLDVRRQDEIVASYLAMVRAQLSEAGWRPQGVELAHWAVEALARVTTPPAAPKKAAAPKPATPKPPKRRRRDSRRRHDRPRPASRESGPLLPMTDDPDADISDEVLQ
jgi:hypothetical protein